MSIAMPSPSSACWRLLAATRRLLASGGPVTTLSVATIVAEAGVSRATFYACFSDKHAVIGGLAQEALAWREEIYAEVLADPELTHERLDELMLSIVGHWQTNRPVLAAIIELAEHDPAMRPAWRGAVNQIAEQAAEQFRIRWDARPDRPPNPDAICPRSSGAPSPTAPADKNAATSKRSSGFGTHIIEIRAINVMTSDQLWFRGEPLTVDPHPRGLRRASIRAAQRGSHARPEASDG